MFLLRRNYAGSIHDAQGRIHRESSVIGFAKMCSMDSNLKKAKHAGGRPKKAVKRDQQLAVMCTQVERKGIELKAKAASISVSEFLRFLALKGQVDRSVKSLPKEILLFTATLNHLAANINQVAKKRNQGEDLNALERRDLDILTAQVKQLAKDIKSYLQ